MRARLTPAWPGLSKHFGLHPWHIYELTAGEVHAYLEALAEIARQHRDAARRR